MGFTITAMSLPGSPEAVATLLTANDSVSLHPKEQLV